MDDIRVKLTTNRYDIEGAKTIERLEWCGYGLLAGQHAMFKQSAEKWLSRRRA
jgi:hypothetical protein